MASSCQIIQLRRDIIAVCFAHLNLHQAAYVAAAADVEAFAVDRPCLAAVAVDYAAADWAFVVGLADVALACYPVVAVD